MHTQATHMTRRSTSAVALVAMVLMVALSSHRVLAATRGESAVAGRLRFRAKNPTLPYGGGGHPGGSSPGGDVNPTYLLPVDPNAPPTSEFLKPDSNINPLNVNSQYQQQLSAGGGEGGAPGAGGLNPNGVPPGSLQPGNVPVGAAAGENSVQPFPQFLEVVSSVTMRKCVNCLYK